MTVLALGSGGGARAEPTPRPYGGEEEQHFPANLPAEQQETCWKVKWGYTGTCPKDATKPAGALFIDQAWFRRSPQEDYVCVLNDLRLSEIFVAYHAHSNAQRYYDITMFPRYGPVHAKETDLGPQCVARGRLADDYTLWEVHDDAPRWRDGPSGEDCGTHTKEFGRRGQKLILWTTFYSDNYRYVIEYAFRDDGSITCRLGATAHNITRPEPEGGDGHLHTACWRFVPCLDEERAVAVEVAAVRQKQDMGGAVTVLTPVMKETGIRCVPEEFTVVRLRSTKHMNRRRTGAHPIGYDVLLERLGVARTFGEREQFTHQDVWVTREAGTEAVAPEWYYHEVPQYANDETLTDQPLAVWLTTAAMHSPRDEDFDVSDNPNAGLALTMWSSFTLKPRNFFARTPLYK